jgi:hypothetical protein
VAAAPSAPWTWAQPTVAAPVSCGGATHEVLWRWGRLVAADHDLDAEAALVALGGEPCPCLEVLGQVRAVLAGGGRWPPPSSGAAPPPPFRAVAAAVELRHQLRAAGAGSAAAADDRDAVARARQRVAQVRALDNRLLRAVTDAAATTSAGQRRPGGPTLVLRVTPLRAGEETSVDALIGAGRAQVRLGLPVEWLLEVAARGLAIAAGGLTLRADPADRAGARVAAVALRWADGLVPQPWTGWLTRTPQGWAEVAGPPVRAGLWWSVRVR